MHAVCLSCDGKVEKALALFNEMEECFAEYPTPNAKYLLFALCELREGPKKEFYMPLLEKLLSFNITFDMAVFFIRPTYPTVDVSHSAYRSPGKIK